MVKFSTKILALVTILVGISFISYTGHELNYDNIVNGINELTEYTTGLKDNLRSTESELNIQKQKLVDVAEYVNKAFGSDRIDTTGDIDPQEVKATIDLLIDKLQQDGNAKKQQAINDIGQLLNVNSEAVTMDMIETEINDITVNLANLESQVNSIKEGARQANSDIRQANSDMQDINDKIDQALETVKNY